MISLTLLVVNLNSQFFGGTHLIIKTMNSPEEKKMKYQRFEQRYKDYSSLSRKNRRFDTIS